MGGLQALRMASCSTINWRVDRDSPTGASRRMNVRLILRVEGSFPIDGNTFLLSRDVDTAR